MSIIIGCAQNVISALSIILGVTKGGRHLKPPEFEHIFVAVITFSPFLQCK